MIEKFFPFTRPMVDATLYGLGIASVILGIVEARSPVVMALTGIGLLLIVAITRLHSLAYSAANLNRIFRGILAGPNEEFISVADYERIRSKLGISNE